MSATIQLTTAAAVLAQLRAKAAVKDHIRRIGLKPATLTAAEMKGWANLYVEDHPALREAALAEARQMILAGALGKRAARALAEAKLFEKIPETEHSLDTSSAKSGVIAND